MSVMQVPRLIVPEFTLGAAVSNNTQERPSASLPVTTRRIGLGSSAIDIHLILPSAGFMQTCIAYVLVIHSSVPAMSVAELVAYAKQSPGELNCASAGIGTVPHLACEYLNKIAGTNILHVPYRDVNSATMATVGNVTQMFFGVSTSAKSQIDSNTLRGLAVSTAQRSLLLPDLPTMIESGYPTFDMPGWGGLFAPARTPTDIVEKLNRVVRRAVERPDLQKRLLTVGMEPPPPQTPADFRTFVENDVARWTQFVDAVGVNKLKGETSQQ
jgi:tripartite-type tricarboxylate transporter receptor subunit TctC